MSRFVHKSFVETVHEVTSAVPTNLFIYPLLEFNCRATAHMLEFERFLYQTVEFAYQCYVNLDDINTCLFSTRLCFIHMRLWLILLSAIWVKCSLSCRCTIKMQVFCLKQYQKIRRY